MQKGLGKFEIRIGHLGKIGENLIIENLEPR